MSFLHVLLIIFCSPLYFLIRGKWVGFVFNLIVYVVAVALLLLFPLCIPFWLIGVLHGIWNLRKDAMHEHAKIMATEMAAAIRDTAATSSIKP